MLYAIEGLDGSGKSSVINLLREDNEVVFKTPPMDIERYREEFDKKTIEERFDFYMAGVAMVSAGAIIYPAKRVFCDRYVLTTLSAHEAMGKKIGTFDILLAKTVLSPKKTFLLTVSEEKRMDRLEKRGANATDVANNSINDKILLGYRKWAKKLGHDLVEIDTSDLTIEQVKNLILSNI